MKTACLECKFFLNVSTRADRRDADIWYNHYCKASPRPLEYNHLTGEMEKPSQEFEFCSVVNRGNCILFHQKPLT